jgi:hypothetical protein
MPKASTTKVGSPAIMSLLKVISAVFAFDTDIKGGDVLTYYKTFLRDEGTAGRGSEPQLHAICVIGKGYWFLRHGTWESWKSQYEYHEVAAFLSGIMDNYKDVARSRRHPKLGRYIV